MRIVSFPAVLIELRLISLPFLSRFAAERLAAHNRTLGIFFNVVFIAKNAVVVACNIHDGKATAGLDVAAISNRRET